MKLTFKKALAAVLLSLSTFGLFGQEEIVTLKRYALVIGNADYQDFPVKNAVADAELIKNSLENTGFKVFYYKNLNSHKAEKAIEDYIKVVNKDVKSVSVIYYSGHGYTDGDFNYFVPVDNGDIDDIEGLKNKSVSLNDVANKIYSQSQIYIIDGGYDNPYKNKARAIGVKGSLKAVQSKKNSNISYLFSSEPDVSVLEPTTKNSVFATTLADQIVNNSKEVPEMFASVRTIVKDKTGGKQSPYVSASKQTFAFSGEQLSRYNKMKQSMELDLAQELYEKSNESVASYENEVRSVYDEKVRNASDERSRLQTELAKQKAEQERQDKLRAKQEADAAKSRTEAENAELERFKSEALDNANAWKYSHSKKNSPSENIDSIEQVKQNLDLLRKDTDKKISEYKRDVDLDTKEKINEIRTKEYGISETDADGIPTKAAKERREKKCQALEKEAEGKKVAREKELKSAISKTDSKLLIQLRSMYSSLESSVYETDSFTDEITVRVRDFNGETGSWPLVITSSLFGYTTLFNYEIPLSYTEVTGKRYIPINKMTERQFKVYSDNVNFYDSLFRSSTDVFSVKVSYKVNRWANASEYRFIPTKCEVIRLDKKSKVIHTEKADRFSPKTFIIYPQTEVRTASEISHDKEKAVAILDKEYEKKMKKENPNYSSSSSKSTQRKSSGSSSVEQKGRNAFIVTTGLSSAADSSKDHRFVLGSELDIGFGKYSFMGMNCSFPQPGANGFSCWEVGFDSGFSVRIGEYARPFVRTDFGVSSGFNLVGKAGIGCDVIALKCLDVTLGYDYAYRFDLGSLIGVRSESGFPEGPSHLFYIGAGFGW